MTFQMIYWSLLTVSPTFMWEHFFWCGKGIPVLQMAVNERFSPSVSPNTSSSTSDRSSFRWDIKSWTRSQPKNRARREESVIMFIKQQMNKIKFGLKEIYQIINQARKQVIHTHTQAYFIKSKIPSITRFTIILWQINYDKILRDCSALHMN